MITRSSALRLLDHEARALLSRLDRVRPFALQETMVQAAAPSLAALAAIEAHIGEGRRTLREAMEAYLQWLSLPGSVPSAAEAGRRFAFLRLRFNAMLSHFDIFSDVMTQRSEYETGVWLTGLDLLAADALTLPGDYYPLPPVVCYLDRGHGAAIRRARTRLPGGGRNPLAIIRLPRERMVGSGVGSSLVHEVGHQGAALLDLVNSTRAMLVRSGPTTPRGGNVWPFWGRWISEILADFWSVSRLGITSTLGLLAVVSLPRPFVFRVSTDDPHPIPWVRTKLSCAIGKALYPDPQWQALAEIWEAYYPLATLEPRKRVLMTELEAQMPEFVELLVSHRPPSLRGASLAEAMAGPERQPSRLRGYFDSWRAMPQAMGRAPASLAFAVLGQASADGKLGAEQEARMLSSLLTHWALTSTLETSAILAERKGARGMALVT